MYEPTIPCSCQDRRGSLLWLSLWRVVQSQDAGVVGPSPEEDRVDAIRELQLILIGELVRLARWEEVQLPVLVLGEAIKRQLFLED